MPKILFFDIETAPLLAEIWGIWEQNVGLNQIIKDWHVMSWAAKWFKAKDGTVYGPHDKIMYMDQRNAKDIEDDRRLLMGIWKLLDEADIVVTQNGDAFDIKKLNARFVLNGLKPTSSFKSIDTRKIAKKKFGFTSNKLEYMTDKLNKKYKKLKHKDFPGHELWTQCRLGNKKAWNEMEKYNKYDVLALEELYHTLQSWDNSINLNLYSNNNDAVCNCGHREFSKNGYVYTSTAKYQRLRCKNCGAEVRARDNLFSSEKRKSLKIKVN